MAALISCVPTKPPDPLKLYEPYEPKAKEIVPYTNILEIKKLAGEKKFDNSCMSEVYDPTHV